MNRGIIIFLRAPELGKVKSRLAATVGDQKALEIYNALTKITLEVTLAVRSDRFLYYHPHIADIPLTLPTDAFQKSLQHGHALGTKMKNAFEAVLRRCEAAIIIGTDCPYLTSQILSKAFDLLQKSDVVIGPAKDGGYYLLGLKHPAPQLFAGIPWSTEQVFDLTMIKIRELGLSCAILETLSDIDYEEDWLQYLSIKKMKES